MTTIRVVLCPVDFSPATRPQVRLAGAICRAFGARLILQHNVGAVPPAMAVGWMWRVARQKFESDHAIERKLEALKESIPGLNNVVFAITRGTTTQAVLDASDQFDADLLVLSTHGVSTEDHTSITDQILNRGRGAVLVLHDADRERVEFALEGRQPVIVVPTDLSADANAAVAAGIMLARALSAQLHLVRLVPELPTFRSDRQRSEDEAIRVTRALVPEDFVDHVVVDLEQGIAVEGIVNAARRLSAACIVIGEQTRLAHGLLHRAPCPVFYVPPERAPGTRQEQSKPSTDESALERHGLKILVAVDGSPASDSVVAAVANRPWPAGTEFEVLGVVHEHAPTWFDPAMVVEAAYADRVHRVEASAHEFGQSAAERIRRGIPGATVTDVVMDGEPARVIVQEAREWGADLIMIKSDEPQHDRHGRHSVSAVVTMDAPCSVEVVRPADKRAQAAEEKRRLRQRDETTAFRGKMVGICSWEHPEMSAGERQRLCGDASPIVDAHGRIIRRPPPASDEQRES